MKNSLKQINKLCEINISSIRGIISILKNIKTDEAAAVRSTLAQLMSVDMDIQKVVAAAIVNDTGKTTMNKVVKEKAVDWAAVTEDIE